MSALYYIIIWLALLVGFIGGFLLAAIFRTGEMSEIDRNMREWNNALYTAMAIIDAAEDESEETKQTIEKIKRNIEAARWNID